MPYKPEKLTPKVAARKRATLSANARTAPTKKPPGKGTPMRPVPVQTPAQKAMSKTSGYVRGIGMTKAQYDKIGKNYVTREGTKGGSLSKKLVEQRQTDTRNQYKDSARIAALIGGTAALPLLGGAGAVGAGARGLAALGGRAAPRAILKSPAKQTPKPRKPPTLYHGSAHPFKKGEVIKPFRRKNGGASATTSHKFAKSYAEGRGALLPKGMLNREGKSPRVFEVKPVSSATKSKKFNGLEWNDPKGLKVIREAKAPKPSAKPTMKTSPRPPLKGTSPKKRK